MKICIDPGHGGKDPGAVGSFSKEKDITLRLGLLLGEVLSKYKIEVVYTRAKDEYIDLNRRCEIANKNKCNYFISIHCNSSKEEDISGTEIYCYDFDKEGEKLAKVLQKDIVSLNNNRDRGVKKKNFYVLKKTKMPALLIETMFISNPMEEKKLNDPVWQRIFAQRISSSFLDFIGMNIEEDKVFKGKSRTSIMGEPLANEEQMEKFLYIRNPKGPYLARLYLNIGKEEGVRGDLAFSQALYETNFFNFDKSLNKNQYINIRNYSNIKNQGFETPIDGIRAHIQHLKAYASTDQLNTKLVDPCFHLVQRGIAPYWEDLDKNWDIPQEGYGQNVVNLWKEMMKVSQEDNVDHVNEVLTEWKREGIILQEIELDQPITWRDYLFTQGKLLKK